MRILDLINMGGAVRLTKCEFGAIRQDGLEEMPLRIEVHLPSGYRALHSGQSSFAIVVRSDMFWRDALEILDDTISSKVVEA